MQQEKLHNIINYNFYIISASYRQENFNTDTSGMESQAQTSDCNMQSSLRRK